MLNGLIVFAALASVFLAALSGQMQALTDAIVSSARGAVELAIGLIGLMAFFLGLMRVIEDAGALRHLARLIGPSCNASSRGFPSSACRIAIEGDDGRGRPLRAGGDALAEPGDARGAGWRRFAVDQNQGVVGGEAAAGDGGGRRDGPRPERQSRRSK